MQIKSIKVGDVEFDVANFAEGSSESQMVQVLQRAYEQREDELFELAKLNALIGQVEAALQEVLKGSHEVDAEVKD